MASVDASYQNGSVVEYYEDDEEMPATERELAEDAPWKQIQKNTFTRWCNEHLKCVNKRIANLETDLSDGLRLIALLEVLSHQKMARYNKRPNFRQMKLENVSVALKFLEREHIRLVSIGKFSQYLQVLQLTFKYHLYFYLTIEALVTEC